MARNKTEVAENLPQNNTSDDTSEEKALGPDDISNMSDDEFEKYLDELSSEADEDMAEGEETTDEKGGEDNEEDNSIAEDEKDVEKDTAEEKPEEVKEEPFKTFATEEEYEAEIQKRIKELGLDKGKGKGKNPDVDKICKLAKKIYTDSDNPLSEVADELEKQYAEHEGMNVEELREKMSTEEDAKKYRDEQDKKKKANDDRDNIIKKWNEEAALIKHIDPDFDFKKAISDEKFKDALLSGKSVHEAYMLLEKKDKSEDKPEKKKEETKPETIEQNGRNPRKGTGSATVNPASMSDADFKKYLENIKNS